MFSKAELELIEESIASAMVLEEAVYARLLHQHLTQPQSEKLLEAVASSDKKITQQRWLLKKVEGLKNGIQS